MKTKSLVKPNQNFPIFGRVINVLTLKLNVMKKWILFLPLFLSLFYSCNKGEIKGEWGEENREGDLVGCIYCDNLGSHAISFADVYRLISAYHNESGFRDFNIGGVFDNASLQKAKIEFISKNNSDPLPTSIFYPAIDYRGLFLPKRLYIAYEIKNCRNQGADCLNYFNNSTESIVRPDHYTSIDRFNEDEIADEARLQGAIQNQVTKAKPSKFEGDLTEHRNNFYEDYSNYYSPGAIAYDKSLVNDALGTLGGNTNKTEGIRYYWGIDAAQGDYQLRVIFCAVNSAGKIIVPNGDWDQAFRESSRPRRP